MVYFVVKSNPNHTHLKLDLDIIHTRKMCSIKRVSNSTHSERSNFMILTRSVHEVMEVAVLTPRGLLNRFLII